MRTSRRTNRDVLRDNSGLSTSIVETLGGLSLKAITMTMVGGLLATLIVFWAVTSASADTSSGFQTANLGFEKAVTSSDVVVGGGTNRVGLLKDVTGAQCEVSTWQQGARDGGISLRVDTKTVAGVCASTTPLIAAGAGTQGQEMLFGITAPVFTYTNLGGRAITFGATGAATLATGTKPADVKQIDWDDVRPYKVTLNLEDLDKNTAKVTKKAVLSAFTNVANVAAAADELRYVPSPSTDPIPGPLNITGVVRSGTTGTIYAGVHEGAAVSFAGGVCPADSAGNAIPTKVTVAYTRQSPSAAPAVTTVFNGVLTGADTTVHLGMVPNGSSGAVDVSATCIAGGVAEKDNAGYTQTVPPTALTVVQNAADEKHDLSWVQVSSLPTSFELNWKVGPTDKGVLATTTALAYQAVNTVGANYGYTSTYTIVATVDTNESPADTASIANVVPAPAATVVSSSQTGASWTAVSCKPGTTSQYASRYYQQAGTSTTVSWTALSPWTTGLSLAGVTTPGYGRTVAQVQTRCAANVSGAASTIPAPDYDVFYAPEAISVAAGRSATTGTAYMGAREGMTAWHSGARCYNGTSSAISLSWQPATPSGQSNVNNARTIVPTGAGQSVELANVRNGASGNLVGSVVCTAGKSSTVTKSIAFDQTLPDPGLAVVAVDADTHTLTWNQVSSLPTSFVPNWSSTNGTSGSLATTTALTTTANHAVGSTYGMTSSYAVTAKVGSLDSASANSTFTAWPTTSSASALDWTYINVSSRTLKWTNGAACPAGTTKQTRSNVNLKWAANNTAGIWANYETSAYAANKASDLSDSVVHQGYPFRYEVDAKCVSAYSESTAVSSQSGNFWNGWNTPATPIYNAYTNFRKTQQPTWAIYDICRNHGTITCTQHPGYGNSIQLVYNTACPTGSSMGASNVHSASWTGAQFDGAINSWDGWETGDTTRSVTYSAAYYRCDSPWSSSMSPYSGKSGTTTVTVYPW